MEYTPLHTIDQAKALVECVYSVYGLTFHRDYVYHPDQVVEMNRSGFMRSFIAVDDGRVVGHLAWIWPFFEVADERGPVTDPGTGEVGISIVRPEYRSQHVQSQLALAMSAWAVPAGVHGGFMKCVTNHTFSQRTAAQMGGKALAVYLAGVPRWVAYDTPAENAQPLSTVLVYTAVTPLAPAVLARVPGAAWLDRLVESSGVRRTLADDGELGTGPTRLLYDFQPSKHLAQVQVEHAGEDFEAKVLELNAWLLGGHMKHVSWYFPAQSARVSAAAPRLLEAGIFPAGWIPALHRGARDAWLFCSIAYPELDLGALEVLTDESRGLVKDVAAGWAQRRR